MYQFTTLSKITILLMFSGIGCVVARFIEPVSLINQATTPYGFGLVNLLHQMA